LEGNGSVPMAAARVMEQHLYFLHRGVLFHRNMNALQTSARHAPCHVENVSSLLCSISSTLFFIFNSRPFYVLFISPFYSRNMRCDLHVHSIASGMCDTPGLTRIAKESYNQPAEVYHRCKHLGMSVVTLTDHDSIDAAEALRKYPDFFLSEEVTVRMPTGTQIHLGVYGITEKDHAEISRRRNDFIALLMYLTERKIFFSLNHVFSSLTGRRVFEDFDWFASYVPAFEVRNGQMWKQANLEAKRLAAKLGKSGVAGSDSHTLTGVARTFTEVPGARTVDEYFAGLRAGRGVIHGQDGSYAKLTADIFNFIGCVLQERPAAAALLPLTLFIPAITAFHWLNEMRFCRQWAANLQGKEKTPRMLWDVDSRFEANWAS
jgi:predicted metal-dependent phosphoesterase TrpH